MTDRTEAELIAAALARLERDGTDAYVLDLHSDYENAPAEVTKPLAALIRQEADADLCGCKAEYIHGVGWVHGEDCALVALCRAIVGAGA